MRYRFAGRQGDRAARGQQYAVGRCGGRGQPHTPVHTIAVDLSMYGQGDRFDHAQPGVLDQAHRRRLPGNGMSSGRRVGRAVGAPDHQHEKNRYRDRRELEPVLKRLRDRYRAHPAGQHTHQDDRDHNGDSGPAGCADNCVQRQAGPLELRHQIQPADADDKQGGNPADQWGPHPDLGEIRQRVSACPA